MSGFPPIHKYLNNDLPQQINAQGRESLPRTSRLPHTLTESSSHPSANTYTFEPSRDVIVHGEDSTIYDRYMAHVGAAEHQPLNSLEYSSPSLEIARENQDLEFEPELNRGWDEGQQESEGHLNAPHTELTHAWALVFEYKQKYKETQEQLRKKCGELGRLRAAYQRLRRRASSRATVAHSKFNTVAARAENSKPHLRNIATAIQPFTTFVDDINEHLSEPPTMSPSSQHLTDLPQLLPASSLNPSHEGLFNNNMGMVCELMKELGEHRGVVELMAGIVDEILSPYRPYSRVTQVENAVTIVLWLIKLYSLEIQEIRPNSRTPAQKFLLANLSDTQFLLPPNINLAPPCPQPVGSVYVDASGQGIGFVFENQWQAWSLKPQWKKHQCRDIQWAEAAAVELGIRLMVRAGYSGQKINLFSDNKQVVYAISDGRPIGQSEAINVIDHIRALCQKHKITLNIKWIPGRENPADGPSRFNIKDDLGGRFPFDIGIPGHLRDFVEGIQVESGGDDY